MRAEDKERITNVLFVVDKDPSLRHQDPHLRRLCKILRYEIRMPALNSEELEFLVKQVIKAVHRPGPSIEDQILGSLKKPSSRDESIVAVPPKHKNEHHHNNS